jgi:hypothetical protein
MDCHDLLVIRCYYYYKPMIKGIGISVDKNIDRVRDQKGMVMLI